VVVGVPLGLLDLWLAAGDAGKLESEAVRRARSSLEQGEADKALKERDLLYRRYRAAKRAHRDTLYREHACGPDLRAFAAHIHRYDLRDAEMMLLYVREMARGWISSAPPEIRAEALSLVNEQIMRIRTRAGLAPFDDPLPGEADDVFQMCKQELAS
jgi:hypothetical protein